MLDRTLGIAAVGMDQGAVFVATCLAAAYGSLAMGIYANYPVALAPGMGRSAFFAFVVVKSMGSPLRRRWRATRTRPACSTRTASSRASAARSSPTAALWRSAQSSALRRRRSTSRAPPASKPAGARP
jgi:hypothetical protein